jgi:hypothetical protein
MTHFLNAMPLHASILASIINRFTLSSIKSTYSNIDEGIGTYIVPVVCNSVNAVHQVQLFIFRVGKGFYFGQSLSSTT